MKIAISSDHAGYHFKETIKQFLKEKGHPFHDFGTHSDAPVDYPQFIRAAAVAVRKGECDRGIVLGGSGNGEAMVANRIPGIRCALCWNAETARLARCHNDANMVSLGARMISPEQAIEIVKTWIETPFEGGRHLKRIQQIDETVIGKGASIRESEDDTASPDGTSMHSNDEPERATLEKYDLLITCRFFKYMEGKNSIEFQVDPGLKSPSVIHIPSPDRWNAELPEWAQNRRDEILSRIKEKTSHMTVEFKEY
ncbi:MAG: ribose 5-phosphate isomerase B [Deltaproteobacteria bacterium]|nr:ribose 5-phosphate isomerase B [Deltaproteobacteria bacterium]